MYNHWYTESIQHLSGFFLHFCFCNFGKKCDSTISNIAWSPSDEDCEDGDSCTSGDYCSAGVCHSGTQICSNSLSSSASPSSASSGGINDNSNSNGSDSDHLVAILAGVLGGAAGLALIGGLAALIACLALRKRSSPPPPKQHKPKKEKKEKPVRGNTELPEVHEWGSEALFNVEPSAPQPAPAGANV